jgi:hypothetical protein
MIFFIYWDVSTGSIRRALAFAEQLNPAHFRVILNGSDLRFPEQAGSLAYAFIG